MVDGASYVIHSIAIAGAADVVAVALAQRIHCLFVDSIKPYYLIRPYVHAAALRVWHRPTLHMCVYCVPTSTYIWIYIFSCVTKTKVRARSLRHTCTHTRDSIISEA